MNVFNFLIFLLFHLRILGQVIQDSRYLGYGNGVYSMQSMLTIIRYNPIFVQTEQAKY
jgi:hypothetical protein